MGSKVFTLILLFYLFLPLEIHCSASKSWLRIGYYNSRTELPISNINSGLFTHLVFSFAYVDTFSYKVYINPLDSQKFSSFTNLVKRKNPSVKTILSIRIGDSEQSSTLLSKLAESSTRKSFIESSIRTARDYGFEGLDLYGVEPSTSLDMANLETILADWRAAIDSEAKTNNQPRLLLVMFAYPMPSLDSVIYPISAMKKNLDWLHLRTYDYYVPTNTNLTYPHAALYDPSNQITNTNNAIQEWIKRGFPSSSLVLGLPFQGFSWNLAKPVGRTNPIGARASGPAVTLDGSMHYNFLKWYIGTTGNTAECGYNDTYVVNYCTIGQNWVNFDDVESIKAKVSYAKNMGLLGYFSFHVGMDHNWALSRAAHGEDGGQEKKQTLLTIILATSAICILLIIGVIICFMHRRILKSRGIMNILKRPVSVAELSVETNDSNTQVLSYRDIRAATSDFSDKNILGQGGFGPVYKGILKGQEIAAKRLSKTSKQGLQEFKNEVMLTARLQHVNLVRVLGYCIEREEKLLIYEYMPNKSLDLYLFDPSKKHLLHWNRRVNIIEGITQALLYLQEYSNFTIIHRDLKASNILLDNELNAKISDFGIARIFSKDENEANTGRIVGTYGYIPPEYARKGIYSTKYDVYSFGVLLLQIISGKRNTCLYGLYANLNLLEYAYDLWKEGQGISFIDLTLLDDSSSDYCKTFLRYMHVALLCVQENPADRPSMLEVSSMLKNETAAIVSPKKPAFSIKQDDESPNIEQHCKCKVGEENCSVNDTTISQLTPR